MMNSPDLCLHEELLLLALRDDKGTFEAGFIEQLLAGAALTELLMQNRISVAETGKKLVELNNSSATGDPVLDECMQKIRTAKRRASLKTWVCRLAGIKRLKHKVAERLCSRGVLKAEKGKVLLIFDRTLYPELDPQPEREILQRLQQALFDDTPEIAPRTAALISLASSADLLVRIFGRKKLRSVKQRIKQIASGELVGEATREVVAAYEMAIIVTAVMPAIVTSSS